MSEILEKLAKYGGVMLSSTASGWCCHVVGKGINRHCHAKAAAEAAAKALNAMMDGDFEDESPTMEDVDEFCDSIDRLMDRVDHAEKAVEEWE